MAFRIEEDPDSSSAQRVREEAIAESVYLVGPGLLDALRTARRREPSGDDVIDEYVYEFVSFLPAEIVGAESMRSTYFREMLAWFHAGYFPCGWEGEWPGGWMRVF